MSVDVSANPGVAGREPVRNQFDDELALLERRTMDGFDQVVTSLERVARALRRQDIPLARQVIGDDDIIDGRYLEVHQSILTLIATQAPVAGDLRLVAALLHVTNNMERMGDQCVNVAKLIPLLGHQPPTDEVMLEKLELMASTVQEQIRHARQAFECRDVGMARELVQMDDKVDTLNRECFTRAIEIGDDADLREWAMTMMLAARAFERIGDNTVDVGEQVAFLVTGLFSEFEDASHSHRVSPTVTGG